MYSTKLSIILPVYNVGEYLSDGIDSIFAQMQGGVEVIAVNDGSTDDSLMMLRKLQGKYPSLVVIDQKNMGVSAARNAGIEASKGDWLLFMDPDDAYADGAFPLLLERALVSSADMIVFGHVVVESQTALSICVNHGCVQYDMRVEKDVGDVLRSVYPIAWNTCYRRSLIGNVRFRGGVQPCEDSLFGFSCLCKAKMVEVMDAALYKYVQRPGSCMHKLSFNRFRSEILAMAELYKIARGMPWYRSYRNVIFRKVRVETIGDAARMIPKFGVEDRKNLWRLFFSELHDAFGTGYVPVVSRMFYRLAFRFESPLIVQWFIVSPYVAVKSVLRLRVFLAVWRKFR